MRGNFSAAPITIRIEEICDGSAMCLRKEAPSAASSAAHVGIFGIELEQDFRERLLLLDRQDLEKLVLAVEIHIEGALGNAGGFRDFAHAGAVEPSERKTSRAPCRI